LFAIAALVVGCASPPSKNEGENLGIDRSPDTADFGYCRTRTCPPPAGYPRAGACMPADWSSSETCRQDGASGAPLWWRSACIGYELDRAASKRVDFDDFLSAATNAFAAWTGATCPTGMSSASSRVSIEVRYLGPVDCSRATYDLTGPNQNVITFHDDQWPYEERDRGQSGEAVSPVIALTTVSFDPESGEIVDADVEINSADHDVVSFTDMPGPPTDAYDLQAVLTHELGHFLGLAHSPDQQAVMNPSGDSDTGRSKMPRRALEDVDVAGICAIYPPDLTRSVSTIVDSSGHLHEGACDPAPRRGLATECPL
jgi:hypothetical protein